MKFKHNVNVMWSYIAIKNIAIKTTIASAIACGAGSLGLLPAAMAQAAKPAMGKEADRNLQVTAAPAAAFPGQSAGKRVALVIGNSSYKDSPLLNPVNDARAISAALKESGFTVIAKENIDQRGMLSALREFGDQLRDGGVGIFYYAGHGMQIKGRNYLIPVGASIEREDEVAYSAVDAQAVLDKMEAAGNGTNIMILDACRNNPFTRSTRSGQAGLAQMDAPVGTLVAFATSPGAVASDGGGQNGLYTQHLLTAMRQQGAKVEDVFKQVRANVRRDSQGKQVPWESTSLEGDFYFKVPSALTAGAPSAGFNANAAVEAALWDAVKNSSTPIEMRAYLNRYPQGQFAAAARARLEQLQPAATQTAALATPAAQSARVEYRIGDSWTFVSENLLTNKQSSYTHRVTSMAANGDGVMNDGAAVYSATAQAKYIRSEDRERFYSEGFRSQPSELRIGFKEPVSYEITTKNKDGRVDKFIASGTIEVTAQEKVSTPAGEFMAWRIKRTTRGTLANGDVHLLDHTYWYAPEIKRLVAQDTTDSNVTTGKIASRTKVSLQKYYLADATLSTSADGIAAVDKRTDELLAQLALAKPASSSGPRPRLAVNSFGYTVGDRWRYQTVDRYKSEVTGNWSRQVDKFDAQGGITMRGGNVRWAADGSWRYQRDADGGTLEYSDNFKMVPATLKAGHSEKEKFTLTWNNNGGNGQEERAGEVKVVGLEKIKVPAGEFEAWKIERKGFVTGKNLSASTVYNQSYTMVQWYVPALRAYAAEDYERRDSRGNIDRYTRQELTSFEVVGAQSLAQR